MKQLHFYQFVIQPTYQLFLKIHFPFINYEHMNTLSVNYSSLRVIFKIKKITISDQYINQTDWQKYNQRKHAMQLANLRRF